MLHLGSPSAAMKIQLKPCMLLQPTVADFLVLKEKGLNSEDVGENKNIVQKMFMWNNKDKYVL